MKEATSRFMGERPAVPGKDLWGHLEQSHPGGQMPVSREWGSAKQSLARVRDGDEGDAHGGHREGTKLNQT